MQVQVDSQQITQLEGLINIYVGWLRALAVEHGDSKGVLRITTPQLNKAKGFPMETKQLKKSVNLIVRKEQEEE